MDESIPIQWLSGNAVVARSGITDDRSRVLKDGDTFAVFNHCGDIKIGGLGEEGLYHEGTRHLSKLALHLGGESPFYLSSTLEGESGHLSVAFTNPDVLEDGRITMPLGILHISLLQLLWNATCYQRLKVKNHGLSSLVVDVTLHFAADFADIFEIRGMLRKGRGTDLPPVVSDSRVRLAYMGLDDVERRTILTFEPVPLRLSQAMARHNFTLAPRQEVELGVTISCETGNTKVEVFDFYLAKRLASQERAQQVPRVGLIRSSNNQVDTWVNRATTDLRMMTTQFATGPYPYAGVPWFNTPFGRDGLITAFECLWYEPKLARGVLKFLASNQATELVPEQDAEPGKILHEMRNGEMAALKEMPFGRYYGSVDATPLFVMLLGEYYTRTAERDLVEELWPNANAALRWLDNHGDRDGDGLIEYSRHTKTGLVHQSWKDSDDAIFHADGTLAEGPFAVCEVQGYAYAARRAGAKLAMLLGLEERARELLALAESLRQHFESAFWCEELSTYALALDGRKRPCRVRTSNAGQCLWGGIVCQERAARVADTLFTPASFSGWGVRTVAETEARYNPMGYHTGSVWPHDNALIALGLSRYGMNQRALRILSSLFDAGTHFDLNRMPELFCGFSRGDTEGPVQYPVACAPQAWAAGSVILLLQACLGLEIDAPSRSLSFNLPQLPSDVHWLCIRDIQVCDASVDLQFERHEHNVSVNVLRREGQLRTVVTK